MSGGRGPREIFVVVAVALAASLAFSLTALRGKDETGPLAGKPEQQSPAALAGTRDLRGHGERSGPYLDGAVSTVAGDKIWLYVLPPTPEDPLVPFAIPRSIRPELEPAHLQHTSALRIYYRRTGDRYVLRGVAHPRSDRE